jgi:hypothetical protein
LGLDFVSNGIVSMIDGLSDTLNIVEVIKSAFLKNHVPSLSGCF